MSSLSFLSSPEVELVLILVDGILFGLGLKKASWALIFIVLAFLLAEYINESSVPNLTLSSFETILYDHFLNIINSIGSLLHIGGIGGLSLFLVVFIVGLAIGYLKG
ncbi:MAG: hypothetical protein M1533_03265 [Candidatus Thermoplasmatota archaeon]|jgi:hypothetical protein|nr:hypothetical protein [Candidatus Thermoplasmatota archaeon]MCL5794086.1 hypothetical protein [Candidatus Thermoplasmatota archaeon]